VSGDVVLIGSGVAHTLSDDPRTPAEPWERALETMKDRLASRGPSPGAETTTLLCAAYDFEREAQHPLLSLLPRLIHLHEGSSATGEQFDALVRLLLHEANGRRAGAEIVIPRLVDSLLVLILRAWLEGQPEGAAGWFGALRDPQIGRALTLLHERPEHPWTVARLSKEVGLSRAAFARRFAELVGEPPLKYLTRWRMSLAARLLRTTSDSVDVVASRVGYDSSTAFGKAFVRHLRVSPGRYRLGAAPSEILQRN
jgi:AraC-like DNA-binding protein